MSSDFSQGKVWKNIMSQAIPLTFAQLVQLLYNIIDRVYLGHLPEIGNLALTGVGLTFPLITLIAAFTNLFGMGGTPLFSIARGAREDEKAEKILGNVAFLLGISSIVLMLICYAFKRPIMFLFGASEMSYVYAEQYLNIYLLGTPFLMLSTGLNGFINAQGFPKFGMMTTIIGAVINIILDPLFIFAFKMDVSGAALATIISQIISAIWVLRFLTGKKALLIIRKKNLRAEGSTTRRIVSLGTAGFMVQGTNCLVQVACNSTLQQYGGDTYVAVMTIMNSVRELLSLPVHGITNGSQPVLGYNYGAKKYKRVKDGIKFNAFIGLIYTIIAWVLVMACAKYIVAIFTNEPAIIEAGIMALRIYFFGFCFMAFQFAGQSTFQSLGYAKRAICFSIFRKVIIVVPLTLLLPKIGYGINGVYLAEPISNVVGGMACFVTMYFTVYRKLGNDVSA